VNPDATVEGRLTGLLSDGNPYIETARSDARAEANSRGLLNSSIAAGAGEGAAIRAALPIASQDAGYVGAVDEYNVAAKNQALMFNANAANTYSLADLEAGTQKIIAAGNQAAQIASAQIASATSRYNAELASNASRYASDANARTEADRIAFQRWQTDQNNAAALNRQNTGNRDALAQTILNNNEIPPERRAALLRALGFDDLANAIFLDVGADLNHGGGGGNGGGGNNTGD
jgi:hypothetical protein